MYLYIYLKRGEGGEGGEVEGEGYSSLAMAGAIVELAIHE